MRRDRYGFYINERFDWRLYTKCVNFECMCCCCCCGQSVCVCDNEPFHSFTLLRWCTPECSANSFRRDSTGAAAAADQTVLFALTFPPSRCPFGMILRIIAFSFKNRNSFPVPSLHSQMCPLYTQRLQHHRHHMTRHTHILFDCFQSASHVRRFLSRPIYSSRARGRAKRNEKRNVGSGENEWKKWKEKMKIFGVVDGDDAGRRSVR